MDYTYNRNCSQCVLLVNCQRWVTLTAARDCPAYDDGTQAAAQQAKAEISAFIEGEVLDELCSKHKLQPFRRRS